MAEALVRERITERKPLTGHDGESGATLERARLDDGSAAVLKRFDPSTDLTMRVAGRTVPLEVELWQGGVLDRLPEELGHAVLGAWQEDGTWLVAMRDLGTTLLGYDTRLSREDCRRILNAGVALHDTFHAHVPAGLMPVEQRVTLFAPAVIGELAGTDNPLPEWVLEGWHAFEELAPSHVSAAVRSVHGDPGPLTRRLRSLGGTTMLHGDYWTPNIAFERDQVTVIDWALATAGPPIVEFVSFLVGCADQVDATRDELVADLFDAWAKRNEERTMRLGLFLGVVEMGWNLAWNHAKHPDPRTEAALAWWLEAAEEALATGLVG